MISAGPAGRFLHVNLNCRDVARSASFYEAVGSMSTVMRTDPEPTDGAVFGVEGSVLARAHFLYDARGPRSSSALELVQWDDPVTCGEPYPDPRRPGLHALCLAAADPAAVAAAATTAGGTRVAAGPTVVRAGDGVVVRDPDGVGVEIAPGDGPTLLAGLRLHCTDLDATVAWYRGIGFTVLTEPAGIELPGAMFGMPGTVLARLARLALPEDRPPFTLAVLQLLDPAPAGSSYPSGNHVGLYRMALRVEDVTAACARMGQTGIPVTGPLAFRLAGTTLDDLNIAFLSDPDGVVVEFVERPASQFR